LLIGVQRIGQATGQTVAHAQPHIDIGAIKGGRVRHHIQRALRVLNDSGGVTAQHGRIRSIERDESGHTARKGVVWIALFQRLFHFIQHALRVFDAA